MSNSQDSNGNGVEEDFSAQKNNAAPPLDSLSNNALNTMTDSVPFSDFGTISDSKSLVPALPSAARTLNTMLDVPFPVVFELGRTELTIAHLMELRRGSFIDIRNVSVDVVDVLVDGKFVAEAEAISLQKRYGVRISEILRLSKSEDGDDAS